MQLYSKIKINNQIVKTTWEVCAERKLFRSIFKSRFFEKFEQEFDFCEQPTFSHIEKGQSEVIV